MFSSLLAKFIREKTHIEPEMKFLIVGLGNIGPEYEHTRHNLGFQVLDFYAGQNDLVFEPRRYGDLALKKLRGRYVYFLKPSTYMNLSGKAIRYWLEKGKIPIENLLVVVDDLNLPLGAIRLRGKGSDGGHNGLKNICQLLGHCNFSRLRFGIGNDFPSGRQVDYVLGRWSQEEWQAVEERLPIISQAIETFVLEGISRAMSKFNSK